MNGPVHLVLVIRLQYIHFKFWPPKSQGVVEMGEEMEVRYEGIIEEEGGEDYIYDEITGEKKVHKSVEQLIDEVEVDPSAPKTMTLNDRIKEYVRTMYERPVTNWRELSDSEEEKGDGGGEEEDETKYTEELDFTQREASPEKKDDESDWGVRMKEKLAAQSKSDEEAHHLCLLDVRSYGYYFHIPYEEMELRNEEQCQGCQQPGELARCICCGGASIISPYCYLPKGHVKQRLVKESRVFHLLSSGRDFSEMELHGWTSSDWERADVCNVKTTHE